MSSIIVELESLLFDWDAGLLDDAGVQRLRELLRTSSEAREFYVRHQMLSAAMRLDVDAKLDPLAGEPATSTTAPSHSAVGRHGQAGDENVGSVLPSRHVFRVSYWAAAVAGLIVFVLASRLLHLEYIGKSAKEKNRLANTSTDTSRLREKLHEPTSEGVAIVTRLVDVTWAANQIPLEVGDALSPGRLAIDSGYAQIEFFCGATVVVEGPAELDLQSSLLARIQSGRLRAQVPPAARGFSLEYDDMRVVDLGTEFGLSVSPEGANVQVFDGEVELRQPSSANRLLSKGEALVRNADGEYSKTEMTPNHFLDIKALESRAGDQRTQRYERWKDWSEKFRRDNRLIAYFAFDAQGDWLRRLNSSREPDNDELDGAIVGANQVAGRWESKGGLEFKRPGDRVRVQIPGEFGSLTFACWVKIDSLDRWYNSLFLTDGYEKGEPHWQILDSGQIYFSVRPVERQAPNQTSSQRRDFKALSPSFWKPTMSGKWTHLAVTCDLESNMIIHYLDGKELSRNSVPDQQFPESTRIGTATIGNWSIPTRPDAEFAIRNLNGSIDEFAILAGALSAEEIYEMYENGKP